MKYEDIKRFYDRCGSHFGVVNLAMQTKFLLDEIEELRTYIEEKAKTDAQG